MSLVIAAPLADEEGPQGSTLVTEAVIAKIAGIAARRVAGVHTVGSAPAHLKQNLRSLFNQPDYSDAVTVELNEATASIEVIVVAEYPLPLQDLGATICEAVTQAVQTLVGLRVVAIAARISDLHLLAAVTLDAGDAAD